jgi:pyridoxamine 5'-phosphate oxidase
MNPIANLRKEYLSPDLHRADMHPDPIMQFNAWFAEAQAIETIEANAMTLCTASPDGRPSARIVLLKGVEDGGFYFYTNFESDKGRQLAANPWAALVFWWPALARQVRIEGQASRAEAETSAAYFGSRPRGSQLGAWASPQSRVIESRASLEQNLSDAAGRFEGAEVPRPPHWGGFRVDPVQVEFWQGRPDRLHDRFRYRNQGGSWHLERLAP